MTDRVHRQTAIALALDNPVAGFRIGKVLKVNDTPCIFFLTDNRPRVYFEGIRYNDCQCGNTGYQKERIGSRRSEERPCHPKCK